MTNEVVTVRQTLSEHSLWFELGTLLLLSDATPKDGIPIYRLHKPTALRGEVYSSVTSQGLELVTNLADLLPDMCHISLDSRRFAVSFETANWDLWLPRLIEVIRRATGQRSLVVQASDDAPDWLQQVIDNL